MYISGSVISVEFVYPIVIWITISLYLLGMIKDSDIFPSKILFQALSEFSCAVAERKKYD
jgi:hypothetical protein